MCDRYSAADVIRKLKQKNFMNQFLHLHPDVDQHLSNVVKLDPKVVLLSYFFPEFLEVLYLIRELMQIFMFTNLTILNNIDTI